MENKIGSRIKFIRMKNHESLETFARKMNVSLFDLENIENGNQLPTFSFIRKFCDDYRLPIDFLFGRYHFYSENTLKKPHNLKTVLEEFFNHYHYAKQFSMNESYFTNFVSNEVPCILSHLPLKMNFLPFCHVGKDTWLDTPQIHFIFPNQSWEKNTNHALPLCDYYLQQLPYHCMFVFSNDMKGVYLTIGLNPNKYSNFFSAEKSMTSLNERKSLIQNRFSKLYDDSFLNEIKLHSNSLSSLLIENAVIGAVYYERDFLPCNEELIEDLSLFCESYHHFLEPITNSLPSTINF